MRAVIAAVLCALVAVAGLVAASPPAQAASGSDFDPGFIISDDKFYEGDAMTASEVQGFLDDRVPTCAIDYTCLKDYRQTTPTVKADAFCKEYKGGSNEPASTIIAKVGAACDVSQKVLLVLIQKETSLVTHTWPSQWRFDRATGFACPDTAPCDTSYGSYFYQVYYAARQYQRYAAYPDAYNYRAGRVNRILYHPNSACGTSDVYIHNQATAGLYIYTPYRPNQAALNNLYGTGDSCSSYGNRNFWRLYNDWFGSSGTLGQLEIDKVYEAGGGSSGALGAPAANYVVVSANGGGVYRRYENGLLAWSAGYGVRAVMGANLGTYASRGGPAGSLGFPRGEEKSATANGGGTYQWFAEGVVYRSSAGSFAVEDEVLNWHRSHGGVSALGWPASSAASTALNGGGVWQEFTDAVITVARGNVRPVLDDFADVYLAAGGPTGGLGFPRNGPSASSAAGGGLWQKFKGGFIQGSDAGTYTLTGAVLTQQQALGGASVVGWPAGPARTAAAYGGGAWQPFTHQTVAVSNGQGHTVRANVAEGYLAAGGPQSLGWPRSSTRVAYASGGGWWQNFDGGRVLASPFGSYPLTGGFLAAHNELGGVAGMLGWPTGNRGYDSAYGVYIQPYQHATVFHTGERYTYVAPELAGRSLELGFNSGALGWTTGTPRRSDGNGGGVAQRFEGGLLTWNEDGGVHLMSGGFTTAYVAYGYYDGPLGWPTTDRGRDATTGIYRQDFQHGAIFHTGSQHTWVASPLLDKVAELGGLTGATLGWTLSLPAWTDGAVTQAFDGGTMTWNESSGVVWTPSA